MQQNNKCRLCGDRYETINHIKSKCSKVLQKEYKTRYDWVDKVIQRELCKKFQSDHLSKWYMHNPTSVLENDTHKLLRDFDIKTDQLIWARRLDLITMNKKRELAKLWTLLSRFTREKLKESEKNEKYLDPTWQLKKMWNMKVMFIPIVMGALGTDTKGLIKGLEDVEIRG